MKYRGYVLICAGFFSTSLLADETCSPHSRQVADSNNLIMLGGTAKGQIRQFVGGEFGKDVNSQKRILGQFDPCGSLTVADISYDKNENNVLLTMQQHISRVAHGWVAEYAWLVKVEKAGKQTVVDNRQGTISWQVGKQGTILSATDSFTNMGKKGFTETTYQHDRQLRLQNSVARGSDDEANGVMRYQWDRRGLITAMRSEKGKDLYSYDNLQRELRIHGTHVTAASTLDTLDECQLWDVIGNCTLSYSRQTETYANGTLQRNFGTAYRYDYYGQKE